MTHWIFFPGNSVGSSLFEQVDAADVDVLALAFADGADVHDEHGVGIEAVFAAQRGAVVRWRRTARSGRNPPSCRGVRKLSLAFSSSKIVRVACAVNTTRVAIRKASATMSCISGGSSWREETLHRVALMDVEGGGLAERTRPGARPRRSAWCCRRRHQCRPSSAPPRLS